MLFQLSSGSRLYGSHRSYTVNEGKPPSASPEATETKLALPRVVLQYRNIHLFPFRQGMLTLGLGPTNSQLTNIAGKPWPLRRLGFSPNFTATTDRIFICTRSTGLHSPASALAQRLPTAFPRMTEKPKVSVVCFSPVHLRRPTPR